VRQCAAEPEQEWSGTSHARHDPSDETPRAARGSEWDPNDPSDETPRAARDPNGIIRTRSSRGARPAQCPSGECFILYTLYAYSGLTPAQAESTLCCILYIHTPAQAESTTARGQRAGTEWGRRPSYGATTKRVALLWSTTTKRVALLWSMAARPPPHLARPLRSHYPLQAYTQAATRYNPRHAEREHRG